MKLSTAISNILNYRKNKRQNKNFDETIEKLQKAVLRKRRLQAVLEAEIDNQMAKLRKVGRGSQFMQGKAKTDIEILDLMNKKFGKRMKELDMRINEKLELIIR